jgi:hypothetical protein
MKLFFITAVDFGQLSDQLLAFEADASVQSILLLAGEKDFIGVERLNPLLQRLSKPIFGGLFPALIYQSKKIDTGFILAAFEAKTQITIIENLSSPETDFCQLLMQNAEKYENTQSMFVLVDGLSKRMNSFIESLITIFGLEFNYIGGGAGSIKLEPSPCVFTNEGIKQDAAILAGLEICSGIGVGHGWNSIAGPFVVTSSDGTHIKELNFKPAFEVYKSVVDNHSPVQITESNFFEIARAYPFGINKLDAEKIVRDPLRIGENQSIHCVGEVMQGSFLDILHGHNLALITAAGNAAMAAKTCVINRSIDFIFFVDCISRVLFLQSDFDNELAVVISTDQVELVFGILSIGEIANNEKEHLEFYNKTAVIGYFINKEL